jgi:hypothetical protein
MRLMVELPCIQLHAMRGVTVAGIQEKGGEEAR